MSDPLVLERQEGRVRLLTLNRPAARNALDASTRAQLIHCLKEADADASVGAIVLTGAGTSFAAGADLRELLSRSSDEQAHFLQPPHIYSVIEGLRKPVVAALNGHALGAGLELATACDLRVCSDRAKLGQPEIALALIPGGGGTQRLVRLVGPGPAARLVLTGDPIDAAEALRLGLVDQLAPPEKVVETALGIAAQVAAREPAAVAAAKEALRAARELPYRDGLAREVELFVRLHARPEAKDRIAAFLEKPKA
ncbi:MAG TPA: enoyl-CoA hydratase/isomerase family protein [Candidatus Thermoplasmatota archaeon]|nr:enoyl-CoA hydratase/isomerase family protein [Candidatus Thermoplasmatota archaeon]